MCKDRDTSFRHVRRLARLYVIPDNMVTFYILFITGVGVGCSDSRFLVEDLYISLVLYLPLLNEYTVKYRYS